MNLVPNKENKMKIGQWVKDALKEMGYEFSVNDTVAFVNRKLSENNEWFYVAGGEHGLAIYDKTERGA